MTRGWGSKVITTDGTPSSRARATTRSMMARWPRWRPSKLPILPMPPRGRSVLWLAYASWTTCMDRSRCSLSDDSGSGGERDFDAGGAFGTDDVPDQVIGVGFGDLHLHQGTGRRRTVVDQEPAVDLRGHAMMAPLEEMLGFFTDPFDEDRQPPAEQPPPVLQGDRALRLQELAEPPPRHVPGHAARQLGAGGPLFRAVGESAQVIEAGLPDESQKILEMLLGLAGEPDDERRAQEDVRGQLPRPVEQAQIALRIAAAPHRREDVSVAVLERHVEIGAEARLASHQAQEVLVERGRVRVEEADPGNRGVRQERLDETDEAVAAHPEVLAVAGGVLGDQVQLDDPRRLELPRLGDQALDGAAAEASAPDGRRPRGREPAAAGRPRAAPGRPPRGAGRARRSRRSPESRGRAGRRSG